MLALIYVLPLALSDHLCVCVCVVSCLIIFKFLQISFIQIQLDYFKQKAVISQFLKNIEIIDKAYSQALFPN